MQSRQVVEQGAAAAAGGEVRLRRLGAGGDLGEQVVADDRLVRGVVDEERVGDAVPGTVNRAQRSAAGLDLVAVGEHDVRLVVRAAADDVLPERLGVGDEPIGDAVLREQRLREAPFGGGLLVVADAPGGGRVERGHARARPLPDPAGEAGVVEVMVREQQQLDVLDGEPVLPEPLLERRQRLVALRARVHERQRLAPEQPEIHRSQIGDRDEKLGGSVVGSSHRRLTEAVQ